METVLNFLHTFFFFTLLFSSVRSILAEAHTSFTIFLLFSRWKRGLRSGGGAAFWVHTYVVSPQAVCPGPVFFFPSARFFVLCISAPFQDIYICSFSGYIYLPLESSQ